MSCFARLRAAGWVLVALIAAGCSTESAGRDTASATQAGRAERPIDVRGRSACSLLDADQLRVASMEPTTAVDKSNSLATACLWKSRDGVEAVYLVVSVNSPMERVYQALEAAGPPQNLDLRGHRAAREGTDKTSGCTVYVELAENQIASAEVSSRSVSPGPRAACEIAQGVLESLIDSLSSHS